MNIPTYTSSVEYGTLVQNIMLFILYSDSFCFLLLFCFVLSLASFPKEGSSNAARWRGKKGELINIMRNNEKKTKTQKRTKQNESIPSHPKSSIHPIPQSSKMYRKNPVRPVAPEISNEIKSDVEPKK